MKKLFFVFVLILGLSGASFAQEDAQNAFWNFDTVYEQPVTSSQSSVSTAEVTGFSCKSVWDDMAKAFSTFVRGLSVRIW